MNDNLIKLKTYNLLTLHKVPICKPSIKFNRQSLHFSKAYSYFWFFQMFEQIKERKKIPPKVEMKKIETFN